MLWSDIFAKIGSRTISSYILAIALAFTASSCGDEDKGDESDPNGEWGGGGGGGCSDCYDPNDRPLSVSLDMAGSLGFAIMQASTSLSLDGDDDDENLVKIDSEGKVSKAIKRAKADDDSEINTDQKLPRIAALGFGPNGYVYVLFEYSFYYSKVSDEDRDGDIWSASSPYTCQLFRTSKIFAEASQEEIAEAGLSNLVCVTNQHEIPTWDRSARLMQFDEDGNMYFPAQIPGTGKQVLYSYAPASGGLTEKVNANICFNDVEVTRIGGLFYTGSSSSGGDCNGASYFRYISKDSALTEISRNFHGYQWVEDENPTGGGERINYYGPPSDETAGTNPWANACLYSFNPEDGTSTKLVTCTSNVWDYRRGYDVGGDNSDPTLAARVAVYDRCIETGVSLGGHQLDQLEMNQETKELYVQGTFARMIAGTPSCNVEITGAHCDTLDPAHSSAGLCSAASGTWVTADTSYNSKSAEATCKVDDATYTNWNVSSISCDYSGQGYEDVKGLAIKDLDETGATLTLLSTGTTEEVTGFWMIDHGTTTVAYYASISSREYFLKKVVKDEEGNYSAVTLLSGTEVYNVSVDPADKTRILFDGLQFSDNSYKFGSIDPSADDPSASLSLKSGLTGQIETLIIVPDF